jgi:hypothetical protein
MFYELIGRLTVWFVKRRALDRVPPPSVLSVIAVAVAGAVVAFVGAGLLLGGDDDDSAS